MEETSVHASRGESAFDKGEINSNTEQKDSHPNLSIYRVLHFIQSEWTCLELQRSFWEMERSELKARIAFLQGERRGQETIKQDLVRRIKMLECALKQERVRYYHLKSSIDANPDKSVVENFKTGPDSLVECANDHKNIMDPGRQLAHCTEQALQSNIKWRESRLKLKHFLQEVGYTDSVLAVRQSRVRQLLRTTNDNVAELESGNISKKNPSAQDSVALPETEEAVLRTFDFLESAIKSDEKSNLSADSAAPWSKEEPNPCAMSLLSGFDSHSGQPKRFGRRAGVDSNLVEFLNSLSDKENAGTDGVSKLTEAIWPLGAQSPVVDGDLGNTSSGSNLMPFNSIIQNELDGASAVGLGDLACLTVANESENGVDAEQCETGEFLSTDSSFGPNQASAATSSRRPWTMKFGLRGHLDAVRSIAFHPNEPYLFSAGEDGLVMLWSLRHPNSLKPNASNSKNGSQMTTILSPGPPPDLEPVHIYRGHMSPVLSVSVPAIGQSASAVYSSDLDGVIRGWRLPSPDPFTELVDLYSLTQTVNECGPLLKRPDSSGDAVWSISVHPSLPLLASVDTSTAVSFWSLLSDVEPGDDGTALPIESIAPSRTIFLSQLITPSHNDATVGRPTSVTFFSSRSDRSNATQCLVGTSTGWLALVDVETGIVVNRVSPPTESSSDSLTQPVAGWGLCGIHAITMYQTFSLAITGHEDRCIRFYDITRQRGNNGAEANNCCVGTIVTNLDAVTCLAVDPHDLYVLTGSHDCSIRLWDLESRVCVQEMTCHRVKNNESIHDVAIHPTMPLVASAGADALCKVYTSQ